MDEKTTQDGIKEEITQTQGRKDEAAGHVDKEKHKVEQAEDTTYGVVDKRKGLKIMYNK